MGIVLTTSDLPPKEREPFWRHVMSDTLAPVTIREMAEGDVAGSIRGHWVGRLLVTDVQSTGQDIRRTPRLISEADNAYFQVAVLASGTGRVSQDDISTRYLHKLFEADHQTVALYIKGLRLDRARRDLLDPRLAGRPISTIAYACGFGDLSGFNRAFKQAYGVSPKEPRNARPSTARPVTMD